MEKTLASALELAAAGKPVFPARLCDRACLKCDVCKARATPHGFKDASSDPEAVKALWQRYLGRLVAMPTGGISGIAVLDVDRRHHEGLAWYRANRSRLPKTRVHRTGSGGLHLLFQHHDLVTCTVSKLARGIDTRAGGGYIIWWPAFGCPVLLDAPLAPWPAWLLAELKPKPHSDRPIFPAPDHRLFAALVRLAAGAPEGNRHALTYWCGCRAGELVAAGLLDPATAIAVIAEAASRSGLPRKEAERTARDGVAAGGG